MVAPPSRTFVDAPAGARRLGNHLDAAPGTRRSRGISLKILCIANLRAGQYVGNNDRRVTPRHSAKTSRGAMVCSLWAALARGLVNATARCHRRAARGRHRRIGPRHQVDDDRYRVIAPSLRTTTD